jgi:CBS domain-containing protein
MQEAIEEELAIMDERSREAPTLAFDALTQPVSSICGGPPPVLGIGASVRDVLHALATRDENCVLIVDHGVLVGLITASNITRRLAAGRLGDVDAPVETVMTPDPETLRLDDSILSLLAKLYAAGFSCVPIVDEQGFPLHVVTVRDAFEALLQNVDREIRTAPPMPYHGEPYVWGG